ncbi:hypothetical protein DFO70_12636 [Cytobacillus firmus]|uniref:Uncharacterized protein n=2 Tax=Cytobacillus TaxID=2675230 RepID=A0A366JJ47_CYTFI|nr:MULTISPECIES: hypothetical protein [Cytobacillus]RBP86428.1 hypothetical protein DFO70_12636 [Cytobacillus firmus]TDX36466.1 hypothetical protein DFO72_11936 [Cytobacillus oceanisediminis]
MGITPKMKVLKRKWELIRGNTAQNESAQEKIGVNNGNSAQNEGAQENQELVSGNNV